MSKLYRGTVVAGEMDWQVVVEEGGVTRPLDPRYDLVNHSPDGFAWGYGGSGPSQLAFAMLADAAGTDPAIRLYHRFKHHRIARLPQDQGFEIIQQEILNWIAANDALPVKGDPA